MEKNMENVKLTTQSSGMSKLKFDKCDEIDYYFVFRIKLNALSYFLLLLKIISRKNVHIYLYVQCLTSSPANFTKEKFL